MTCRSWPGTVVDVGRQPIVPAGLFVIAEQETAVGGETLCKPLRVAPIEREVEAADQSLDLDDVLDWQRHSRPS
ncbi:hypothetical protein M1248_08595 [Mycobacterium sp. 29Ha]|nr:hypothetical protein [Mycobacterium sp. 29Ha]MDV3132079.1 hypothetical protein [Mycobacterium sp. 29Ha]